MLVMFLLCLCCAVGQVESGMTVKGSDNVDIGCGNAFGGDDEVVDDSVEKVLYPNRIIS